MRVVASWSGGKDSCYACYKAISAGFDVACLLNFVSKDDRRCMSHGLDSRLISAQSQATEIPLIQRDTTWNNYEESFKVTMTELKQIGIEGSVFGDIDIQEHRDWVDRICNEVSIKPLELLWGLKPDQILIDFIEKGFEAIVVNVRADLFGREWLGRKVDRSFIDDLQKLQGKHDIHICGESGEYHTFVIDGPFFKKRIEILDCIRVLRGGYWKHWLLDITNYELVRK